MLFDLGDRIIGDTKTKHQCVVTLGELERHALKRHRRAQAEVRLRRGPAYIDRGYAFTSPGGDPLDADAVTRRHFKPILTAAKLPAMRMYDLRHSCASILVDAGAPIDEIRQRLGHASALTTLKYYVHAHPEAQAKVSAQFNTIAAAAKVAVAGN